MTSTPAKAASTRGPRDVRTILARFPLAAELYDFCLAIFRRAGWSVGVEGSCAIGTVDAFSDLDFVVICPADTDVRQALAEVSSAIGAAYDVMAWFLADHVGLPTTLVTYVTNRHWVVKVDIRMVAADAFSANGPFVTVHDPRGAIGPGRSPLPGARSTDRDVLREKACGWLWYSYAKIMRGEMFQAARSLDYTREHALLPCLLDLLGLPADDGHRHIEQRLPEDVLDLLRSSYPRGLDRAELLGALDCLGDLLVATMDSATWNPATSPTDGTDQLRRMLTFIRTRPMPPGASAEHP